MLDSAKNLLNYRSMIWNLIKREVRGRYKGSILGFFWNFITPLVQILVYIIVFSAIFKPNLDNYAIYLTCGMIMWIYFSDAVSESSWILVGNSDMLKKIYFPRSALPIAQVLSKLVNYFIMLAIFIIIALATGFGVDWLLLLTIIPFTIVFVIFIIGISLILSALDVYFRDIQYIVTVSLMALIWLTPIMYSKDSFDMELLSNILAVNPMTYFVEWFHSILYWKCLPDMTTVIVCLVLSASSFIIGYIVFNRLENNFAEVL